MDGARLCGVEHRMTRMICGVRVIDRVLIDVLRDRIGVFLKIEDMIIQSCLRWYRHVMCRDINSQIHEVMEVEITGKGRRANQGNLKIV